MYHHLESGSRVGSAPRSCRQTQTGPVAWRTLMKMLCTWVVALAVVLSSGCGPADGREKERGQGGLSSECKRGGCGGELCSDVETYSICLALDPAEECYA